MISGGVVMGDADDAVALAERLGCPVVNSYLHNDSARLSLTMVWTA